MDFGSAISINPNYDTAYSNRGSAYIKLGECDKAIADYDRSIAINPNNATDYRNRSTAYTELGEYANAVADYDRAIAIDPNDAVAYHNRGGAYVSIGGYAKAIADFDRAVSINPNLADAYKGRGDAYLFTEDYDKAIADYSHAISINPNDATPYNNRGLPTPKKAIMLVQSRITPALSELIRNDAVTYYGRGTTYNEKGGHAKAIADFDSAISVNPNFALAYGVHASAHAALGNAAQADRDMQKYRDINGDTPAT